MKSLMALFFIVANLQLMAQKSIDGLINAEKRFTAYSVSHGTKEAFLKFLDSNAIVFEKGKAVNGIATWKNRQDQLTVLKWRPQYVEIATSNDFGYTTGPWELYPSATSDSVVARGRFSTVWHMNASRDWKVLVDLGVGNTPADTGLKINHVKIKKRSGQASDFEAVKAEKEFIAAYLENKLHAYKKFSSHKIILLRNGRLPAKSVDDVATVIGQTPRDMIYTVTGAGISAAGDLAFLYGNTSINNKAESYLRVWRKEKDGWRIAMEVLRY